MNYKFLLNRKCRLASLIFVLTASLLVGCEKDFEYQPSGRPNGTFNLNMLEYLQQTPNFDTLVKAIAYAGLTDMFTGTQARTFFALPNERWRLRMTNGTRPITFYTPAAWRNTIMRHFTDTRIFSPEGFDVIDFYYPFQSLNGERWTMRRNASNVLVGGPPPGAASNAASYFGVIRTSNIQVTNGIIHVASDVAGNITP